MWDRAKAPSLEVDLTLDRRRLGHDHATLGRLLDLPPAATSAPASSPRSWPTVNLPVSASVNVIPCWAAKREPPRGLQMRVRADLTPRRSDAFRVQVRVGPPPCVLGAGMRRRLAGGGARPRSAEYISRTRDIERIRLRCRSCRKVVVRVDAGGIGSCTRAVQVEHAAPPPPTSPELHRARLGGERKRVPRRHDVVPLVARSGRADHQGGLGDLCSGPREEQGR